MPKATSGGASNAWLENEPGYQPPVESEAAPVAVAEVPADAEVTEAALATGGMIAAPSPVIVGEPGPELPLPPVASMSKAELQDHADSLGLPTDGTKADLAARIVEHHEAAGGVVEEPAAAVEPEV